MFKHYCKHTHIYILDHGGYSQNRLDNSGQGSDIYITETQTCFHTFHPTHPIKPKTRIRSTQQVLIQNAGIRKRNAEESTS